MGWRVFRIVALGQILMVQVFVFSVSCRQYAGCRQYNRMGVEAAYCRLHREAVWNYVELADTEAGLKERIYSIARLLEELKRCNSIDCVDSAIAADTIAPGFYSIYSSAHEKADEKLNGVTIRIKMVTLCGLENGLGDWDHSLGLEVNLDD